VVSEPNILSVGASTCIMGLLGCYLGYFILNWKGLNTVMPPEEKCITFTIVILMTLLIISSSTPSVSNSVSNIDYNGHFGGIIGGIFLSIIVP
jgi:membrane associated rhomboid family serine protease